MLKYRKLLVLQNECFIKPWMLRIQCWQRKFTIKVKIFLYEYILLQAYLNILYNSSFDTFSADSSYCWAFSISSMIRHSLNMFLRERKKNCTQDQETTSKAEQYLNSKKFHQRLRNGFETKRNRMYFSLIFVNLSFFFKRLPIKT